ncbi:MAG: hypothetical protein QXO16_04375 [Archaeoglobaceae archaeon]
MNFARAIFLYFLVVNAVCVLIFLIPELKPLLSASYGNLDLASIAKYYTSNFVHNNEEHLLGNLIVFNLVGIILYLICRNLDKERELFQSLLFMLVFLPLINNLILFLMHSFASIQSCGLSTFVSAVVGLLIPASVGFLGFLDSFRRKLLWVSLILLTSSLITFQYAGYFQNVLSYMPPIALFIVAFVLLSYVTKVSLPKSRKGKLRLVVFALTIFVYFIAIYNLFPSDLIVGSGFINIVAHGVGLIYGMFTGYYTLRVWH